MLYNIVHPYNMSIYANSFNDAAKDAVKEYIKVKHYLDIRNLIITDQTRYMRADLEMYNVKKRKKVGITLTPTTWPLSESSLPLNSWPFSPSITYDTKEYQPSTFLQMPTIMPFNTYKEDSKEDCKEDSKEDSKEDCEKSSRKSSLGYLIPSLGPLGPLGPVGHPFAPIGNPYPPIGTPYTPLINPYGYNIRPNFAGNVYNYKNY